MTTMGMLIATDWLWPFVLAAMVLVAVFTGTLVWAQGAGAAASAATAARAARWPVWALTLAVPLVAIALYAALGHPRALNPQARNPVPDEAVETMVSKLAARLQTPEGNHPQGWLMLARSYKVLGRHAEAAEAWEHAEAAAWDDADELSAWIEARTQANSQHFDARSRQLLARAMALAPEHPGVLMLRALAALDDGRPQAAAALLAQLQTQYPAGSADHAALAYALDELAAGRDPRAARSAASTANAASAASATAPGAAPAVPRQPPGPSAAPAPGARTPQAQP